MTKIDCWHDVEELLRKELADQTQLESIGQFSPMKETLEVTLQWTGFLNDIDANEPVSVKFPHFTLDPTEPIRLEFRNQDGLMWAMEIKDKNATCRLLGKADE